MPKFIQFNMQFLDEVSKKQKIPPEISKYYLAELRKRDEQMQKTNLASAMLPPGGEIPQPTLPGFFDNRSEYAIRSNLYQPQVPQNYGIPQQNVPYNRPVFQPTYTPPPMPPHQVPYHNFPMQATYQAPQMFRPEYYAPQPPVPNVANYYQNMPSVFAEPPALISNPNPPQQIRTEQNKPSQQQMPQQTTAPMKPAKHLSLKEKMELSGIIKKDIKKEANSDLNKQNPHASDPRISKKPA